MTKTTSIALGLVAIAALVAGGCENHHRAERAGEHIDNAATKTGNAVETGADKTADATKKAANKTGNAVSNAGDKIQDSTR